MEREEGKAFQVERTACGKAGCEKELVCGQVTEGNALRLQRREQERVASNETGDLGMHLVPSSLTSVEGFLIIPRAMESHGGLLSQ